jgi:triacylglycerol lipase
MKRRKLRHAALALCATAFLTQPVAAEDYTATQYPIVLAHGIIGFDALFGIYQYWYGIPAALEEGGAEVYVTEVAQFASTEARGEHLLAQIEEIIAITGAEKVNLIGHSQGGLDSRYVAAVRPDLVASVTTVGTPHAGAEIADFIRDNVEDGSLTETVGRYFAERLGDVLAFFAGTRQEQDAIGALETFTSASLVEFNERYPNGVVETPCGDGAPEVDGIRFYSWGGNRWLTNILDPSTPLFALSSRLYSERNDGLVGQCSSRFGKVIRDDYRINHVDQVNQLLGLTRLFGPSPKSLFRIHANRLRLQGL